MKPTLILADARLADGTRVDVVVSGETIAAVVPAGSATAGPARIDCGGGLVAPSFVEGHIHLDKTLLGLPHVPHVAGDGVAARIAAEKQLRRSLTVPVEIRGGLLIEQIAAAGTGSARSHVDVDTELRLGGLHALLALKQSHRDLIDLQIVAFPQSGVLRDPGTADLLDAAIRDGADLVGGIDPAGIDDDVTGHLDAIFAIAARRGVGLDIHLHDPGPLGAFELRQIAARTRAAGLVGRVAVSHAFALGMVGERELAVTAEPLAAAGIAIMTNGPGSAAMPPVKLLAAAGVRVFAGSDNIRDAWSPYGNGDLLERAAVIGLRHDFRADAELAHAFAMVTTIAADVLGLAGYGVAPGARADIMVLPVGSIAEAVSRRPARRTVIKRGRVVAQDGALLPRG